MRFSKVLEVSVLLFGIIIAFNMEPACAGDFSVLDLKKAARAALEKNPDILAASARVEQAGQLVKTARAEYWPKLGLSGRFMHKGLSRSEYASQLYTASRLFPGTGITDPQDYYSVDLTATWTIFDGFARRFKRIAAEQGLKSGRFSKREAQRLLLNAVCSSYFAAQLARQGMKIAEADEDFNLGLLKDAEKKYAAGTGSLSDILNFRIRANRARYERLKAEAELKTAMVALGALMGRDEGRLPAEMRLAPLADPEPAMLGGLELGRLKKAASDLRPDIALFKAALEKSRSDARVAAARFFPDVVLSASLNGSKTGGAEFSDEDFGNSIAVTFSYPLFAGGAIRADYLRAKAGIREAEQAVRKAEIDALSEVEKIAENLLLAQQQYRITRDNAEIVREQRDLVKKAFRAGQQSLVRLNEAQRDLVVSLGQLARTKALVRKNWYDLMASTGQILDLFSPE